VAKIDPVDSEITCPEVKLLKINKEKQQQQQQHNI